MRCGVLVPRSDCTYIVAERRTPADVKIGYTHSKLFSATLCHECGKAFHYDFLRWMEVGE